MLVCSKYWGWRVYMGWMTGVCIWSLDLELCRDFVSGVSIWSLYLEFLSGVTRWQEEDSWRRKRMSGKL